jgi:hypothetical protein
MASSAVMEEAQKLVAAEVGKKKAARAPAAVLETLQQYFEEITNKLEMLQTTVETGLLTPHGASHACAAAPVGGSRTDGP